MTYKLIPGLRLITSPIKLLLLDGGTVDYENGEEACNATFDKHYGVVEIRAVESVIEVKVVEKNEPNVAGDSVETFF